MMPRIFSQGGKLRLSALLFTVVAAFCVTSCGNSDSAKSATKADLVFINGAEVTALDPVSVSDQVSGRVITSLFEGLLRYNQAGRAEPGCAELPEISSDGRTLTFRLRPEACWVQGAEKVRAVTALDFEQSWRRFLEPTNGAEYSNVYYCIVGAEDYYTGKEKDFSKVGIKALDERTLQLQLVNPTPYLLDLIPFMCFCPVFHKDAPEKTRDLFKPGKMVGNGAYYLEEWRLNDRIRLRKNKHYWDAANVKLETIDVLPISNASTALNLFLNRDADLMIDKGLIPPNLGEKLRQQPYFHYKQFLGTWFIRFNVSRPPFDNAKVRKAFALAIDRQRIVEKITQYGENVAISMVPPGAGTGYTPPPGLGYDPALAKLTLAEAGFADGKGIGLAGYLFPTLSIEPNIATELQSMWQRNLGVRITLPKQEYKAYLDAQKKVEFDLCRSSWIGDYNDPNTFLDMFTSNSGNNRTNWKNADYDKIILAAGAEVDPAKRYELFRQAEDLLVNQECVVVPVYHYVGVQFYRDEELGGIESNLTDEHPLRCIFRR